MMRDKNAANNSEKKLEKTIHSQKQTITELRQKIVEINREYEVLKYIISIAPEHLYWKDTRGVYLGSNNQQAESLGLKSAEDIVGKTDTTLPWKKGARWFQEIDHEVMKTGEVTQTEEPATLPDGRKVDLLSTKRPLYDPVTREIIGVVGISTDITNYNRNKELEKQRIIAQEKIESMELLAGIFAHELRTPLAGITAGLAGLETYLPALIVGHEKAVAAKLVEPVRRVKLQGLKEVLSKTKLQVKYANGIIDLQLRNIKAQHISKGHFIEHPIANVVHDAVDAYPLEDHEKGLVNIQLQPDFDYVGDKTLTRHIIWNLIKNALYSIKENSRGEIYIYTELTPQWNILHVKDTAGGLSQMEVNNIFQSFFTTRPEGAGLGLSFCQIVMRAYEGEIFCRVEEQTSTDFMLRFPHPKPQSF